MESRVPLLRKAFARCGVTCAEAVQNDAAQLRSDWGKFDRILCDVPADWCILPVQSIVTKTRNR